MRKMNATMRTREIRELAITHGADLVGVADLNLLKGIFVHPSGLLKEYKFAISIAVNLERFGGYDNRTEGQAFSLLKKIASSSKDYVEGMSHRVKIIPPGERVEKRGPLYWMGALSHKAVAKAAGLSWIGKSTLLVTPGFGPRVCLITVLTDMALTPNNPSENRCGSCEECIKACPVNALTEAGFDDHPKRLEDALNVTRCGPWIDKTWRKGKICYNCMLACPCGRTKDFYAQIK